MKYRICLPWNEFFATRVYLWGNLPVRLAIQRKSLRKFNLRPLALCVLPVRLTRALGMDHLTFEGCVGLLVLSTRKSAETFVCTIFILRIIWILSAPWTYAWIFGLVQVCLKDIWFKKTHFHPSKREMIHPLSFLFGGVVISVAVVDSF